MAARGWNNKRVGQIGEFLFCAELARNTGCIATPFAGNLPSFDVLVANESGESMAIQVKTIASGDWQFDAKKYLDIAFDHLVKTQTIRGRKPLDSPELVFGFVKLRESSKFHDRFFIMTAVDLQTLIFEEYTAWLSKHSGRRPRNWETTHCAVRLKDVEPFEHRWRVIENRLHLDPRDS
ncbi:MAG: hypothetical protein AAGH64_04025 [Planctomycetota bacterium]